MSDLSVMTLDLLDAVRKDKLRAAAGGVGSNCGHGLPYWQMRERLGVRGPLARLRLRRAVSSLECEGLVRRFTAYDTAACVGVAIERTAVPSRA